MKLGINLCVVALLLMVAVQGSWAKDRPDKALSVEQLQQVVNAELPPPPKGFVWKVFKNAVFPKPETWHEREMWLERAETPFITYAASAEAFSLSKQFEVGLTLQIFDGPQRHGDVEARKMALIYLKPFLEAHKPEEVLMLKQAESGDMQTTLFRYRDAPPGMTPIIVHKYVIANNVADSVHIFTFESPVETWEANWQQFGTPIFSKLNVLPNLPIQ